MLPIQNLLRRKVRTFFALLGIAVGISAVVSIVSTAKGLRNQFYKIADQFAYDVIVQQRGAPQPMLSHLRAKDKERIEKLPGVRSASLLAIYMVFRDDAAHPLPVLMVGLEPGGEAIRRYQILKGRALRADDKNVIVLGELGAQQLGLDVGGKLKTADAAKEYEVVGIFRAPVAGVDLLSGQAVANLDFLSETFDVKPNVAIAHLRTAEETARTREAPTPTQIDAEIAQVASAMAATDSMKDRLEAKAFKSYLDSFKQMELVDKFAWAMSFLAALVGGIGIANTMLMSVFERTREIGLLRAVGWSRSRICSLIVMEGIALSLVGGALGVPLGWLEVIAATEIIGMGWIQTSLEPAVALQAVALAVVIGIVGSLYPGLRAANLEPTEALRYE
jgi:putative ABC transport system permease protein